MDLFVAEWRESKGLSQAALARMAGISRQTLSAIEKRKTVKPHPSTLQILAMAIGCPVNGLYSKPPGSSVQEGCE